MPRTMHAEEEEDIREERKTLSVSRLLRELDAERTAHSQTIQELAQARRDQWQPIETAPKDGSDILVCEKDGSRCVANWDDFVHREVIAGWRDRQCYPVEPLYWMPLPDPPGVQLASSVEEGK